MLFIIKSALCIGIYCRNYFQIIASSVVFKENAIMDQHFNIRVIYYVLGAHQI